MGALDLAATPALLALLAALAWIDGRERRLPDRLTLPLVALGLLLAAWREGGPPLAEAGGAALGFAVFWALGAAFHRARGVEGLGLGDAKLLAAAGAWLGAGALPLLVLAAALAALLFVAVARAAGRRVRREVAFGPWLALAFAALWLGRVAGG